MNAYELHCLVRCLWLHDIGHTGLEFRLPDDSLSPTEGKETRLRKFKGFVRCCGLSDKVVPGPRPSEQPRTLRVAPFPSLVRLFHNFLSAQRICDPSFDYLPADERDAVALISMYDRGKMPLTSPQPWWNKGEGFDIVAPPLDAIVPHDGLAWRSDTLTKERVLLLSALLRVIDGLDIQSDRAMGRHYWKERKQRTQEELAYYLSIWKEKCQLLDTSMGDTFESVQQEVNTCHSRWQQTFELPENDEGLAEASQLAQHIDDVIDNGLLPLIREALFNIRQRSDHGKAIWLETLSLTNRLLFKMMQEAHFRKHSHVKLVHLTCIDRNSDRRTHNIYMTFDPDIQLSPQQKRAIADEIWKEIGPAQEILQQQGGIVFNGIFDWRTGDQLQPDQGGAS